MHLKLICASQSQVWEQPGNAGFEREEIIGLLDGLQAQGHTYEVIDGDAISADEQSELYGQAMLAVAHAGNRYRIRQVFGSRRRGGGDALGKEVPALIVFEDERAVGAYPHQIDDGYVTIRDYLSLH